MTTASDSFTRSVQSALSPVHELGSQEAIVLALMDGDRELALDDAISGDFPASASAFGLSWRANQQVKSCLLVANSTDGDRPPLIEEVPNWSGLLKESMESSALAWWVLGPVDRRTRAMRRLELAMHERRELRPARDVCAHRRGRRRFTRRASPPRPDPGTPPWHTTGSPRSPGCHGRFRGEGGGLHPPHG